jgi:phosphoribosylglycinamide formyltransferase-1
MKLAVFVSGRGSNLKAILDKIESGELKNAEIELVISNNSDAGSLVLAEQHRITALHLSARQYPSQEAYEQALLELLRQHGIELILLAGYMKLLPANVVAAYHNRILNIHPALLPRFGGKGMYGINVHKAVLAAGEKESGATVHYVNEVYDEGQILAQQKVPVYSDDTPETLAARVLRAEHDLYWRVVDIVINKANR